MKTKSGKLILMGGMLFFAVFFASCSKDDPAVVIDKTALKASITSANLLLTTTSEGVATGNYLKGSQAPLTTAIAAAQTVVDDVAVSQVTVTNATVSLAAAVTVYDGKKVVPIDPANLIGQWTFDQITAATIGAVVKDYSGNGRDGSIKAGHSTLGGILPVLTTDRYGVAGKALALNKGANVEIPYNTALNPASISISVWVKLAEVRNNRFMGLQSWIGYKFEVQDGNIPFATIGHTGGSYDRDAVVKINQNEWYHLVMTYTAGTMVFYINGLKVRTHTDTPNPAISISGKPYNLVFGQDFPTDKYSLDSNGTNFDTVGHADFHVIPLAWGGYLHGSLDEVRIYKSVLTESQVTTIYNVEKP